MVEITALLDSNIDSATLAIPYFHEAPPILVLMYTTRVLCCRTLVWLSVTDTEGAQGTLNGPPEFGAVTDPRSM